ncbi:MAG: formylmethanofuran dehydrogenase subunit A [Planctomycetota bacterium]
MKTLIQGGRLVDPSQGLDEVRDFWIENQVIASKSWDVTDADQVIDASNCVVMSGGIDIHTHVGGGKLSIARLLMQDSIDDSARKTARFASESDCLPSPLVAAQRYLEMGYTTVFEPAVIPCNARSAHSEMVDMPGLATGGFCLLGNDEVLLQLIAEKASQAEINNYVAWMVNATKCIAVKVVNAGGISAFKYAKRNLDVDTPHPSYGVTPGQVIRTLARAVHEIGLRHPLHVHASNLGVPGNIASTLATIEAANGFPIHLTHAQFHCYSNESEHGMSSAAAQLVDALKRHRNVTIDVGQIMFGQTVTISADAPHQFANFKYASPKKTALVEIECEAGCGVVPFRYRRKQFVHSLQWAIGLELFLMLDEPDRVFLTTDHPNGAPFTSYPHLLRLLGDRSFRETALQEIHPDAIAATSLLGMDREYTLPEIATMTRSAPAEIMGLVDRGNLASGSVADLAIYRLSNNLESMFSNPIHVFVKGKRVAGSVSDDELSVDVAKFTERHETLVADLPSADRECFERRYQEHATFDMSELEISKDEFTSVVGSDITYVPTSSRTA